MARSQRRYENRHRLSRVVGEAKPTRHYTEQSQPYNPLVRTPFGGGGEGDSTVETLVIGWNNRYFYSAEKSVAFEEAHSKSGG